MVDRGGADPSLHYSGAFSNVYKAQDLTTGQKVASTKEHYRHLLFLTIPYSQGRS
jgi:hypothetical protein